MTSDDSSAAPAAGGGGRTPRQGSGGSPVGSTLSIVLAVVAVVAGFLILRNITDDGDGGEVGAPQVDDAVIAGSTTSTTFNVGGTTTTTTTTIPRVTEGATVVVANANSVGGSAGRMSKTLETVGYTMGSPVNSSTGAQDDTIVYYDATVESAEAVATSVGIDMGCVDVLVAPTPPPTEGGTFGGAGVIVALANDRADQTIEEMAESCVTATEAPDVSGSSDATTTTTTG